MRRLEILAALLAAGAGVYLLLTRAAADNSIFNPLLHGIGVYFIARGIWMFTHAGRSEEVVERLDQLVELGALDHANRSGSTPTEPAAF